MLYNKKVFRYGIVGKRINGDPENKKIKSPFFLAERISEVLMKLFYVGCVWRNHEWVAYFRRDNGIKAEIKAMVARSGAKDGRTDHALVCLT
ncbi:hypothetical protein MASR2M66_34360 [Chloroflexota bacterium]